MIELILIPIYAFCRIAMWVINTVAWLFSSNFELETERLDDFFYHFRLPLALMSAIAYYTIYICYFAKPISD